MNLIIDSLHNRISLRQAATKKEEEYSFEIPFNYSLSNHDNLARALTDFLKQDQAKVLFLNKGNHLLIPDNGIGFGSFDLPALSKARVRDAFDTRFKLSYPNFNDYYVHGEEYGRNASGILYFYTFAKKSVVDLATSILKAQNIEINSVSFLSAQLASISDTKDAYPKATLIVGETDTELIITKGQTVLFVYDFGFGSNLLDDGNAFLDSAYQPDNEKACRFAGFAAENFAKKIAFSDENIAKVDPNVGFPINRPKELRVMKDEVLANYKVKNNYRKFYALILDIINRYTMAPWFLPLGEVEVFGPTSVCTALVEAGRANGILQFSQCSESQWNFVLERQIEPARLFSSVVKKERRRFDWRKLLTMEIGGKKKG